MQPDDAPTTPGPAPDDTLAPPPATTGIEPATSPARSLTTGIEPAASPARSLSRNAWLATVAAALLAGAVAWPIFETYHEYFQPSEEAASQAYDFRQLNKEESQTNSWNGAIVFGALGALLGLALGVAGGVTAGSTRGAVFGAIAGVVLGGIAGALPPLGIMPWHWMNKEDDPATLSLARPLMMHAGLYCALGLTAGLAYGLGRFGGRGTALAEAALGGLIGAAVGTFLYEITGAVLFPLGRTADPIAAVPGARLLALLLVSGFVALGVLLALRPAAPRKPKASAAGVS